MARKNKTRSRRDDAAGGDSAVRDSAQKIWLAGLGAFERAKTEGPRMFETLVEQGRNMGARAVGAADEALKSMRQANYSGTTQKLEQALEEGISKSLSRLGVLTSRQVEALQRQVEELNDTVRRMGGAGRTGAKRKATATKRTARKKPAASAAGRTTRKRSTRSRKAKA